LISIVWGGVDYPITQPYGPTHRGIDIGCPMGTALHAARAGVVTTAAYWGVAIKVDGTNQTDWYLHISDCQVQNGWRAAQGAGIALSGMTPVPGGPTPTGPHLHFEVQTGQLDVYATSLDPVPVLEGLYGGFGDTIADMAVADDILAAVNAINAVTLRRMEDEILAIKVDVEALRASQPSTGAPAPLKLGGSFTGTLTAE
jgi:Peptidase family M23